VDNNLAERSIDAGLTMIVEAVPVEENAADLVSANVLARVPIFSLVLQILNAEAFKELATREMENVTVTLPSKITDLAQSSSEISNSVAKSLATKTEMIVLDYLVALAHVSVHWESV